VDFVPLNRECLFHLMKQNLKKRLRLLKGWAFNMLSSPLSNEIIYSMEGTYFAKTIQAIRVLDRKIRVEVLIPDFKGEFSSLTTVLNEDPNVLNHNIETGCRSLVRGMRGY